jgi:hypothetical protein
LNPGERPFDNYRTAITDPPQFFGRDEWLGEMRRAPFWVRVLLGGRLGKTSALRAVEWSLLDLGGPRANRPFSVFISLELEQPSDLPNFLFILVDRGPGGPPHNFRRCSVARKLSGIRQNCPPHLRTRESPHADKSRLIR